MKKRRIVLFVIFLSLSQIGAQTMNNDIQAQVTRLFVYTDQHEWEKLENIFAERVVLDYSSFTGAPAAELTAGQIVQAWRAFLPGFKATHHQTGNYLIESDENTAKVFCYGTATHYLPNESGKDVWVVVGSYDFELVKTATGWQVAAMKFNFKYQDGNTELPQMIQNAKQEEK